MPMVDLWINTAELVDAFEHMRSWLDHEECVPVNFDQAASGPGKIHIHVEFEKDDLADAFEREFGSPSSDPTL
jgi:hypothetical protein